MFDEVSIWCKPQQFPFHPLHYLWHAQKFPTWQLAVDIPCHLLREVCDWYMFRGCFQFRIVSLRMKIMLKEMNFIYIILRMTTLEHYKLLIYSQLLLADFTQSYQVNHFCNKNSFLSRNKKGEKKRRNCLQTVANVSYEYFRWMLKLERGWEN